VKDAQMSVNFTPTSDGRFAETFSSISCIIAANLP